MYLFFKDLKPNSPRLDALKHQVLDSQWKLVYQKGTKGAQLEAVLIGYLSRCINNALHRYQGGEEMNLRLKEFTQREIVSLLAILQGEESVNGKSCVTRFSEALLKMEHTANTELSMLAYLFHPKEPLCIFSFSGLFAMTHALCFERKDWSIPHKLQAGLKLLFFLARICALLPFRLLLASCLRLSWNLSQKANTHTARLLQELREILNIPEIEESLDNATQDAAASDIEMNPLPEKSINLGAREDSPQMLKFELVDARSSVTQISSPTVRLRS